jgi:hypothetical protein
MKIQILTDINDCIDGYNPVFLENGNFNIDVPDNSVLSILMIGSIESVPYQLSDKLFGSIRKLLRINGKLTITGLDAYCVSRDLINNVIDSRVYNEIIFSRKALYDSKELCDRLSSLGLTVEKIILKGSTYELHATRSN